MSLAFYLIYSNTQVMMSLNLTISVIFILPIFALLLNTLYDVAKGSGKNEYG